MKGYIYILTNPSFRDWVKIGYADNVEERVKQLNSKECTPFAFRIYATYEVNSRLMDKKIHTITLKEVIVCFFLLKCKQLVMIL